MESPDPDLLLLLASLPRPMLWVLAAFMCWRMRTLLPVVGTITAVGCTLNAINITIFGLLNANYLPPNGSTSSTLLKWVTGSATVGVALTVVGGSLMIQYLLRVKDRP